MYSAVLRAQDLVGNENATDPLRFQVEKAAAVSSREAVRMLVPVTFLPGKATLTAESLSTLKAFLLSLAPYKGKRIRVEGHTDSSGSRAGNVRLSLLRAKAIVTILAQNGFPANTLEAVGHGPDKPVADNRTASGRARNRRVEIHIEP